MDFEKCIMSKFGTQLGWDSKTPAMQCQLERTGEICEFCDDRIRFAHEAQSSRLTVSKRGKTRDENGYEVRAFSMRVGEFLVADALYIAWIVDELYCTVHLLLVRSDVSTPMHVLFPNLGTARDWKVMQKCADRFSPKWASKRSRIELADAQETAVVSNAQQALQAIGGLRSSHMIDVLSGMGANKLHMLDLLGSAALYRQFPNELVPQMSTIVRTGSMDDLDEFRRIIRAWDMTVPTEAMGQEAAILHLTTKKDTSQWKRTQRLLPVSYEKNVFGQTLIDYVEAVRSEGRGGDAFRMMVPCVPILVGPSIWSDRNCVELDFRQVRFTDDELIAGRQMLAALICGKQQLLVSMKREWDAFLRKPDTYITPYCTAWHRCWHYAAAEVLFPDYDSRIEYLELCKESDAARLRLRDDRASRYAAAIAKLKAAEQGTDWLYPNKPKTREEALKLLSRQYKAFRHTVKGEPVMAFTAESLIRCTAIEPGEFDDFVLKLKQNGLIERKTHPITFQKGVQWRFTCVKLSPLTVTPTTASNEEPFS